MLTAADPGGAPDTAACRAARPHLAVLDGMRGVAVLAVLVFHLGTSIGWAPHDRPLRGLFYSLGTFGVELFFVLSAFVLFLPTLQRETFGSRWSYAVRRAARIVPAYLLCIGIGLAVRPFLLPAGAISPAGPRDILIHLTFTQVEFLPKGGRGFGVDGVVWTLSIEVLFYVLLPLVAVAFARRPTPGLILAALISLGWCLLGSSHQHRSQFPSFAICFAVGMYAAWVFTRRRAPVSRRTLGAMSLPATLGGLFGCVFVIGLGACWP